MQIAEYRSVNATDQGLFLKTRTEENIVQDEDIRG